MIKKKKVVLAQTPDTYPMRINKYLAHKGVATRTGVDDLIKHQKILINGNVARLGDSSIVILFTTNQGVSLVQTHKTKKRA